MAYLYKVVPFSGSFKTGVLGREGPETASKQLEDVINSHVSQGWEFYSVSQINMLIKPGCLAFLFGDRRSTVPYDQVIFRRSQ